MDELRDTNGGVSSTASAASHLRGILRKKLQDETADVSGGLYRALKIVDNFIVQEKRGKKFNQKDVDDLKTKVKDAIMRGEPKVLPKESKDTTHANKKKSSSANKSRSKTKAKSVPKVTNAATAHPIDKDETRRFRANENSFSIFESSAPKIRSDTSTFMNSVATGNDSHERLLSKGLVHIVTRRMEPWTLPGNVIERAGRTVPTEYDILARHADGRFKDHEKQKHLDEARSKQMMKEALLKQMEERKSRSLIEMEEKKIEAEKIQKLVAEELKDDEIRREKAALLARREMEDRKQQVARTRSLHLAEMERNRQEDQRRLHTIMQKIRDTDLRKRQQLIEDRKKMAELQVENMKKRQDKLSKLEEERAADLKLMVEYDMMLKKQADRREEEREKVVARQLEMFHRAGGTAMEISLFEKQKEDEAKAIAMAAEYERKTNEAERVKREKVREYYLSIIVNNGKKKCLLCTFG